MMPEVTKSTQSVSNPIDTINLPDPLDYQSFPNPAPILTAPRNISFQSQYDSQSQAVHSANILNQTKDQSFFNAFQDQYYAQSEAFQSYGGPNILHDPSQSNAGQFPFQNSFLHNIPSNINSTTFGAQFQAYLPNTAGNTIESGQLRGPHYQNPEVYPQWQSFDANTETPEWA
jgi:hypothetical protein